MPECRCRAREDRGIAGGKGRNRGAQRGPRQVIHGLPAGGSRNWRRASDLDFSLSPSGVRMRSLVLLLVLGACAAPTPATTAPSPTLLGISADELRRDLHAFAADSCRGRETGTPDEFRAARWLANRLTALGVEPAGDSFYFHRVPLARQVIGANTRLMVNRGGTSIPLAVPNDVMPWVNLGAGAPLPKR